MKEIIWKPELHRFSSCKEFVEEFRLGASDLILTNEYIYQPYFGAMNLECAVLYQEQYGMGEPTDVMAEAILRDAAATGCSRVVAIGGGTVIDIAKVLAVGGGESIDELYGMAPELPKRRELVLIPTTCGTGSEVTNISILNRTRLGTKMGLVGPAMYADAAVLIPQLLEGLPFGVFATSSIDALVHAVESSLSPKATPYTKLFGYKAIEGISDDRPGGAGGPPAPAGGLPDCVELCGLCIRYGWVRGGARHELPAGGKIPRAPRGEQLRDVYRRVEELHGDQAGRRACGDEPLSGGAAGLRCSGGI
mgnify:CR=1 FL=1